jgi:hypothetical protein
MRMMKSAKKWRRKHATNGMCTVGGGGASVLIRRCMLSRVIVGRVRSQQMTKMPLAEHDNVVKTFPPLVGIYESILSRGRSEKHLRSVGFCIARTFVQVLKQCGDNLTRENLRVCPGTSNGITEFSEHQAD